MLQNLRRRVFARCGSGGEAGFTLIELLVVMLILGILAAIALPAFFNQKTKAGDAKAKEYAHSAQVAMETCYTDKGTYVGCTDAVLKGIEPSLNNVPGGTLVSGTPTATGYKLTIPASAATGANAFSITNAAGTLSFTCTTKGKGGCPDATGAEGNWGA